MHDGRRNIVASASAAARGLGLRLGMPLAQAQAMVPGLTVRDAAPAEDAAALERLAAWCLGVSPLTAADPPDGVWIDVTGCAHLYGGEEPLLRTLLSRLGRKGMQAKAAIADTPGAAHALARFGDASLTIVAPGGAPDAMALLPIAALRLDPATGNGLRRLGLRQVGQLAKVPRGPLARRFGHNVLLRLDQALGRVPEAIQPVLPPGVIAVRREFVEPISTPEAFHAVIQVLVAEACTVLDASGKGARQLDLVFERVDGTMQVLRVGTARPVRHAPHLVRLLGEQVETVEPRLGIEAMRLVLPLVEPLPPSQDAGLVPGEAPQADLSELVDRLLNRLGTGTVYHLHPTETDVPERVQQATSALADKAAATWVSSAAMSPWPRPVRLLRRPEPVEALALLPSYPPRAFTWRRVRHLVTRADGPERITGEWWRATAERDAVRDYWTVENQAGRRFWLFRQGDGADPATGSLGWFLHGFF